MSDNNEKSKSRYATIVVRIEEGAIMPPTFPSGVTFIGGSNDDEIFRMELLEQAHADDRHDLFDSIFSCVGVTGKTLADFE